MALIPPAILAALLGASIGNALKQTNKKPNRITLEPFPGSPSTPAMPKRKSNGPLPAAKRSRGAGSAQNVRRARQLQIGRTVSIAAPATMGAISRNRMIQSTVANGGLILSHCEPFASAQLSALGVLSYQRQAFIPGILPYLSGIASNFGKYAWKRLHIYYVPSVPTSTEGEVAMGTVYDRNDASGATFIQTAQMKCGISFPPWGGGPEFGADAVCFDIDCSDFDKPRYSYIANTAFNALGATDQNVYCPVTLTLASQGFSGAVPISIAGRIWLSYTVHLTDPIPSAVNA